MKYHQEMSSSNMMKYHLSDYHQICRFKSNFKELASLDLKTVDFKLA